MELHSLMDTFLTIWAFANENIVAVALVAAFPVIARAVKPRARIPFSQERLTSTLTSLSTAARGDLHGESEFHRMNLTHLPEIRWQVATTSFDQFWKNEMSRLQPTASLSGLFQTEGHLLKLVLTGLPGSGKTALLLDLFREDPNIETMERTTVPVVFNLTTWDPSQPLKDWLSRDLRRRHEYLEVGIKGRRSTPKRQTLADLIVNGGHVRPLFDNFEQIDDERQPEVLKQLLSSNLMPNGFVLASRPQEFNGAVTRIAERDDAEELLSNVLVLDLLEPTENDLVLFMQSESSDPAAFRFWNEIKQDPTLAPILTVMRRPLMASLTRYVYNGFFVGLPNSKHPEELRNLTSTEIEAELFRKYLTTSYSDRPTAASQKDKIRTYDPTLAQYWHENLALHIASSSRAGKPGATTTGLSLWELRHAIRPSLLAAPIAVVPALATAWATLQDNGLGVGLGAGIIVALAIYGIWGVVREKTRWRVPSAQSVAASGRLDRSRRPSLELSFLGGIVGGALAGLLSGWITFELGLAAGDNHFQGVGGGAASGALLGIATNPVKGLALGSLSGLVVGTLASRSPGPAAALLNGLAVGLIILLIARNSQSSPPLSIPRFRFSGRTVVVVVIIFAILLLTESNGAHLSTLLSEVPWVPSTPFVPLATMFSLALLGGYLVSLVGAPPTITATYSPHTAYTRDSRSLRWSLVSSGILLGLIGIQAVTPAAGIAVSAVGMSIVFWRSQSGPLLVASIYMSCIHRWPFRVVEFLKDAHEVRGILRQVGGDYQYRHPGLYQRLLVDAEKRKEAL